MDKKELNALVDASLQAEQDARKDRERSGKFNPSSFGKCFRAQCWNRLDEPQTNPPDIKGLRRMKQGTYTHKLNQAHLPKDQVEVKVETDDVLGFADFVSPQGVLDYKCSDGWNIKKYSSIPTPAYIEDNPDKFLQVAWYALELKKEDITIAPTPFGEFNNLLHTDKTANWKDKVDAEITTLMGYWGKGELPPAKPRCYGGKECNYCSWKDKCKEETDGYKRDTK